MRSLLISLPLLGACNGALTTVRETLPVDGLTTLAVSEVPGRLVVVGDKDRRQVEVRVRLYDNRTEEETDVSEYIDTGDVDSELLEALDTGPTDDQLAEELTVRLTEGPNKEAQLAVDIGRLNPSHFKVVAKVWVPRGMNLHSTGVTGDTRGKHLGNIDILDDDGFVVLKHIEGDVDISDGDGGIRLRDVVGDIDVVDANGRINIEDVEGDLIIRDGKGGIRVRRVSGKVTVWDTRGSQNIEDVGELEVHTEGEDAG